MLDIRVTGRMTVITWILHDLLSTAINLYDMTFVSHSLHETTPLVLIARIFTGVPFITVEWRQITWQRKVGVGGIPTNECSGKIFLYSLYRHAF